MRSWFVGGAVAVLGCSSGSNSETGLRTSTDQHGPALPPEVGEGADELGAVPSSTEVSGTAVPVDRETPGAVGGTALDACPASADFVPLGVVPDEYSALWKVLDPHAGYAYWTHEYSGNDVRVAHYRWTALGGIENLDELLHLPAARGETWLDVQYVSSDGGVILSSRLTDDYRTQESFRYTPKTGAVALDFYPVALGRDGRVALGLRETSPLRWTEAGGTTELVLPAEMAEWNFSAERLWLSEPEDTVIGVGVSGGGEAHVVRWTSATGWVDLGVLPAGAAAPNTIAMTLSESGHAMVGTLGNPAAGGSRAFRWTEASGSTELGVLAGLPAKTSYMVTHVSTDGSVVVGSVQIPGESTSRVFRWTEALGMQDLMPGVGEVYPAQMSARGDVVIARATGTVFETNSHRWTERGGVETLDLYVRGASADGTLLVGARGAAPAIVAFHDGSAPPTLAELAPPTVVPADWSEARSDGVSADGHLIVGTGRNPQGEREGWLLRRIERCPAR